MIEVPIPQDLNEFEPKILGAVTTRQAFCIIAGAILGYTVYAIEVACGVENAVEVPLYIIPVIPCFLLGWIKPYGIKMEDFLKVAIISNFVSPCHRVYKENSFYDQIIEEAKKEQYKGMTQKEIIKLKKAETKAKKKKSKINRGKLPQELRPYR